MLRLIRDLLLGREREREVNLLKEEMSNQDIAALEEHRKRILETLAHRESETVSSNNPGEKK